MKRFIFGLTSALVFSSTASADCLDTATKAIEQKGFTLQGAPSVESLSEPSNGGTTGYRAWLRVARCENGYVIVNMHPSCAIESIWTEGDCDVPQIRQALRSHN
jgi:hypothetical protein